MAKIIFDPRFKGMKGIRGKLDGLVFRQTPSGETILAKAPDMSNVEWSPAQKEQRQRMKQTIAYAQAVMADPQVRTVYEKQVMVGDASVGGDCVGRASAGGVNAGVAGEPQAARRRHTSVKALNKRKGF